MNQLTERRLEERERRRLEILDAAEALASVVGIEAMTMDQGCAQGAPVPGAGLRLFPR